MKILKLKLFQETACYKKPFAFKVAETYPLPPYSTVIGMFHKILKAKPGEYFPMNISIQGNYESIFSNYQTLRMFKGDKVTSMPRNVHLLLNVDLLIHVKADDEIINKIYENIVNGEETFTLGRNEDLVRVDEIKFVENVINESGYINKYNAFIPSNIYDEDEVQGINYRLNTTYVIENNLRKWNKVDVKFVEKHTNTGLENIDKDEDGDYMFFYIK